MTDHTPTPWNCASRYSSVVGVPIINQQGRRVGNTALPDMPPEWDHMKRQGEIDAAFICKAVNNHDALVNHLRRLAVRACDEAALELIHSIVGDDPYSVMPSSVGGSGT